MAAVNWEQLDGSHSEDLLSLPFDRFFNRLVAWLKDRMTTADWRNFESRISLPPPGVEATSGPWSDQEMGSAFDAFSREFGS